MTYFYCLPLNTDGIITYTYIIIIIILFSHMKKAEKFHTKQHEKHVGTGLKITM